MAYLKEIKRSPTRQCTPFDPDPNQNPDLRQFLKTQAYIRYKCYGFINTAVGINPILGNVRAFLKRRKHDLILSQPTTPHANPATPLPDIVHLASEILRCLHIDRANDPGCLTQQQ